MIFLKLITLSNCNMFCKKSILDKVFLNRLVCCSWNGLWLDHTNHKMLSLYSIGQQPIRKVFSHHNYKLQFCKLSSIIWNSDSPCGTFSETDLINHSSQISSEKLEYPYVVNIGSLSTEAMLDQKKQTVCALDTVPDHEFIDNIAPFIGPTFNMAVHVNNSSTLQELVKLGVKLYLLEHDAYKARFVLSLKFEEDVKPFLLFLHSLQVPPEEWGRILTINPFLLEEDQDVLLSRVEYLKSKNFPMEAIAGIIAAYPQWLSKSIVTVDSRLGFLQKQFSLTGDDVRVVTTKLPKLIFHEQMKIVEIRFILYEEFGFTKKQMKDLIVHSPDFFLKRSDNVRAKLLLITKKMALSLETVMQFPGMLTCKGFILENRHFFLKSLGRAQYDPTKANFVSPETFADVSDPEFATEVARSSVCAYHAFQKTL